MLDPFLNQLDERFHALVAKNMMHHPLMPTLYDNPVVNMNYDRWDRLHIWVHKQPLFLWQIALSFKLLGISEFTLRIPSVILATLLVLITYRSALLLTNQKTGYISAVLVITSLYLIEMISGRKELDHNDVSFMVYISLSLWSFIEYWFSKKKRWILLIGLFSGLAILCKWLVGLLVYLGWFIYLVQPGKSRLTELRNFIFSLLITIVVAAPWQIFIFSRYPAEALMAYEYNVQHFLKPLDGHSGNFLYHFDLISSIYGPGAIIMILPALYLFYRHSRDRRLFFILLSMVLAVYLFFSFTATKMPSFTTVVFMVVIIAFATLLNAIIEFASSFLNKESARSMIFSLLILLIVFFRFDTEFLTEKHGLRKMENKYSRMLIENKNVFESLKPLPNTVLFNVKGRHYIEAMFYLGIPAYNFIPSRLQVNELKSKGMKIAIFMPSQCELPDYLTSDPDVTIINKEIQGYD